MMKQEIVIKFTSHKSSCCMLPQPSVVMLGTVDAPGPSIVEDSCPPRGHNTQKAKQRIPCISPWKENNHILGVTWEPVCTSVRM